MRLGFATMSLTWAVALLTWSSFAYASIAGGPKVLPRKADVPYIKCEVCRHLARNAYDQAQQLLLTRRQGAAKVDEGAVIDLVERATVSWKEEGEWMARLHLQATSAGTLGVRGMRAVGECGEACKTIERAAEAVMGEHDTDIAEALFTGKLDRSAFEAWMCNDLTRACASPPPALPKGHPPYPPFKPRGADDQNLDRVMGEMSEKGLKGRMYTREELMEKYMGELEQAQEDELAEAELEKEPAGGAGAAPGGGGGGEAKSGAATAADKRKVEAAIEEAKRLWAEKDGVGGGKEEL